MTMTTPTRPPTHFYWLCKDILYLAAFKHFIESVPETLAEAERVVADWNRPHHYQRYVIVSEDGLTPVIGATVRVAYGRYRRDE